MVKKLHVGNLGYSVTDETLKEAFAPIGTVESATVIRDRISGRSKGFGFVEMSTDQEAANAIEKLNKTEFEGRTMFVSESRSPGDGKFSGSDGNRSGGRFGGGRDNDGGNSGYPRSDRRRFR
jgi:RNA recognition motif-containing protein